jgi:hypothetical protein
MCLSRWAILTATLPVRYLDCRYLAIIKLFSPQGRRNTMLAAWKLSIGNRPPQLVEGGGYCSGEWLLGQKRLIAN